jgi:hypothetical protein
MKKQYCRHRAMWIIAGGYWSWCYECGAIQQNRVIEPNACVPVTNWVKPVGKGGENPHDKLKPRRVLKETP